MARRSAELAIVRDPIREAQRLAGPAESPLSDLENEIARDRDQPIVALLNHVVERIASLTGADGVAVAVRDQWGVVCRASTGEAPEVGSRLRSDSALTQECFDTGQLVICDDAEKDYRVHSSIAKMLRLRSAVVVPLKARDSVLGVLEVFSSRAFAFDIDQVAGLRRVAAALAPVLASGLSARPPESVVLPLPHRPEEPKSKTRAYLLGGTALLLFILILLLMYALFHRQQTNVPPAPASSPTSTPARQPQPAAGPQDTQAEIAEGKRVEPPAVPQSDLPQSDSSRPDLKASTSSPSPAATSSTGESRVASIAAQPEKPLTTESQLLQVVRPSLPALAIQGAPPGTQAKLEPLELPAAKAPASAPLVAIAPAIPPPVISTRTAPPDFVLEHTLKGHSGWVTAVAFTPDGQRLVSGSWDQTLKFWELPSGEPLGTVAGQKKEIQALAFSRDGRWLATENSSNAVTLREAGAGQEVRTLATDKPLGPLGSDWVYSIAFSPDGQWLATALDGKTVRLWDVRTGRKVRDFTGSHRQVMYMAFSPDGRLLVSGDGEKTIQIWNVASGEELRELSGHRKPVYAVAFSPNGRLLASASGDKTVKLWDVATGSEVRTLTGHESVVTSLAFSPDGRWLISGSWDKTIKIWDVETGRAVQTLAGHNHPIYSVAFDSRGHWLASGSEDGTIKLWRLVETAQQSRTH